MLRLTGKKLLGLLLLLSLLNGCSGFSLLSSGSSLALSNNTYAKAYSGLDFTTTLTTDKDIKTHAYHYVKKAKELKKLVRKTIAHDFDGMSTELVTTHKVIMWELYQPDASILLASNKKEKLVLVSDVFQICYLSFFLAVSMVTFIFVLVSLFIYLFHCIRKPITLIKKTKKKKRKIKRKIKKRK